MLRAWRFLTLLLAALGLGPGMAHVLELPPKMAYDPEMYMAVTNTLYRLFGLVGGPIQVGAFLAAVTLTIWVRRRPAFGPTLIGTLGLALSLGLWTVLVAPVNAEWAEALRTTPATAADPSTFGEPLGVGADGRDRLLRTLRPLRPRHDPRALDPRAEAAPGGAGTGAGSATWPSCSPACP